MIRSRVVIHDRLGEVDEILDRKIVRALNAAATDASAVANEKSGNVGKWAPIRAHGTENGFASGIRADTPLWRVYDKGSLGKRTARLKDSRRKPEWPVSRGSNPYVAHRRSTTTGGVAARNIINPARTAGRKTLFAAVRR